MTDGRFRMSDKDDLWAWPDILVFWVCFIVIGLFAGYAVTG